jgi:hypothetical protein
MVGMLREDSRMEFHANGPYNDFITNAAKGSALSTQDDRTNTFFEKIVEISDAVRDKLRFTLFVATQAQTTSVLTGTESTSARWALAGLT